MKLLICIIGLIICILVSALISIYTYRNAMRLWDLKKEKLNIIEKLQVIFYIITETKIFQRDKSYISAAVRILAEEVYDYIVIKDPSVEIANQILREKTALEINDYWDSPIGRLLKIRIEAIEHHKENILIISVKSIEKQSFKIKKPGIEDNGNKGPKLRIVK